MKKELTYNEAFSILEDLIEELEEGNIQLDKLSAKVNEANELIAICETKLRKIEAEVKDASKTMIKGIQEKSKTTKKLPQQSRDKTL